MTKKWLDSIEKQRRRIDLKKRYKQTDIQTESTTKNSRLLAGAESITSNDSRISPCHQQSQQCHNGNAS